jgi:hypothetical protein
MSVRYCGHDVPIGERCPVCCPDHPQPAPPASDAGTLNIFTFEVEKLLPATYFSDRDLLWRIEHIVNDWRRLIEVNKGLEERMSIFTQDVGGNSTLTRLKAEVECNKAKSEHEPVTDSSLTHGDLRKLLAGHRADSQPDPNWLREHDKQVAAKARLEEQQKHGGHMHNCQAIVPHHEERNCNCGYRERIIQLEREAGAGENNAQD